MQTLEKTDIQLGYIPLLDSVALLWADHQGYFKAQGLNVALVKEPSWASLRDRLAFGFLDAAHCLSAMLPAAATGEDQLGIPLQTSLILNTNQAFISLSQKLCFDLRISGNEQVQEIAVKVVDAIHQGQKIKLAHVFKQSIHHYCLKEWLALADEKIAKDLMLSTLPPPYMVEAISSQLIDGFCVGEPWNTQAIIQGYSNIVALGTDIIPPIADKVLATTHEWTDQHPNTFNALKIAIQRAQQDLDQLEHLDDVWNMLQQSGIIRFECSEQVHVPEYHKIQKVIRSFGTQSEPNVHDFEWILNQMQKWENLKLEPAEAQKIIRQCIGV